MKNLQAFTESVLYMVVNFYEKEKYESELPTEIAEMCSEFFEGNIEMTKKYLSAGLTFEVYKCHDTYAEGVTGGEKDLNLFAADHEFQSRLSEIIDSIDYKANKFRVLSPDGIDTQRDAEYEGVDGAVKELNRFIRQYERQGYYSFRNERIELADLAERCSIIPASN